MLAFIVRRLLIAIPILILSSFLCFLLVVNAGDPIEDLRLRPGVQAETIAAREAELGLNKPVVQRYAEWAGNFVRGDLGKNLKGQEVRPQLVRSLGLTLRLVLAATIISILIGLTVGVVSAVRQYSAFDYTSTGLAFLFYAMPVFWFAVLLKQFGAIEFNDWLENPGIGRWGYLIIALLMGGLGLAIAKGFYDTTTRKKLVGFFGGAAAGLLLAWLLDLFLGDKSYSRWISTTGSESTPLPEQFWFARVFDYFGHTILPMITLAVISFAAYSRFQRASMLETLNSDYVRTAKAKGITQRRVIMKHAFRTALIPVVTLIALNFAAVLGGAFITENIFAWKGMGTLFRNALLPYPDPNPAMAYLMVTAIMVVLFNIMADIAYAYLDPRIRLD